MHPRAITEAFDQGVFVVARDGVRCELTISGILTQDAIRKLWLVLDDMEDPRCALRVARLNIDGGNINVVITVGSMLRNRGFDTRIDVQPVCQTACLLVFASGVERVAPFTSGNVGFSALTGETNSGTPTCINQPSRRQLLEVGRYLQAMLDPAAVEGVLAELRLARCHEPRLLSAEMLQALGLATRLD